MLYEQTVVQNNVFNLVHIYICIKKNSYFLDKYFYFDNTK